MAFKNKIEQYACLICFLCRSKGIKIKYLFSENLSGLCSIEGILAAWLVYNTFYFFYLQIITFDSSYQESFRQIAKKYRCLAEEHKFFFKVLHCLSEDVRWAMWLGTPFQNADQWWLINIFNNDLFTTWNWSIFLQYFQPQKLNGKTTWKSFPVVCKTL